MGMILSLFNIASSRDMPFGIPQYVQCTQYGLAFVLLCFPFFSLTTQGGSVMHGFPKVHL